MNYVRFVAGTNRDHPPTQHGVVTELRMLKESGMLAAYEVEHIDELFEWFNEELSCPPFSEGRWSADAISWFKSSARDLISRFRDMIAILEIHARPVRMITTDDPGRILYEDEYQVVAESRNY